MTGRPVKPTTAGPVPPGMTVKPPQDMTTPDPYLEAMRHIDETFNEFVSCIDPVKAAAYLRERFVTREEFDKAQETVRRVQASARTLTAAQSEIYESYRKASAINTEAVATLDSEREANALLTAEVSTLTTERDALKDLVAELAHDLEGEVRDRWGHDERLKRQFNRDMDVVHRARQALGEKP